MMDTAPAVATWSWKDTMQAAAMSRARARVIESYHKTQIEFELQPFSVERKKFLLPFNPPQYEDGKEKKMLMVYLAVTAGPLEFKVMRNTDPGNVILRSHEIRRRCGDAAAEKFKAESLAFLAEKPRKEKPERKPLSNPFAIPATGITLQAKRKAENGLPMFEYKNAEKAAEDIIRSATLSETFKATKRVRTALDGKGISSRRRKAA